MRIIGKRYDKPVHHIFYFAVFKKSTIDSMDQTTTALEIY